MDKSGIQGNPFLMRLQGRGAPSGFDRLRFLRKPVIREFGGSGALLMRPRSAPCQGLEQDDMVA